MYTFQKSRQKAGPGGKRLASLQGVHRDKGQHFCWASSLLSKPQL